jgi:quercetin dioxygenase-like cupin family protein
MTMAQATDRVATHPYETFYAAFEERRRLAAEGRIVLRGRDLPFQRSRQGRSKYYLHIDTRDAAIKDWQVFQKDLEVPSGKHIHQGGLTIYILRGRGYSIFDDQRLDWKAGDLLSLPIKPGGLEHQHFNLDETEPSRWVAFIFVPFLHATGSMMEQVEGESERATRPKHVPQSVSSPRTLFEQTLADAYDERIRRAGGSDLVRLEDCPVEVNPMGKMRWYLHPRLTTPSTRALYFHELEIAPGSRSGRLQCQGGLVHLVLEGSGYTEVDGMRHEWDAEDLIGIPIREHGVTYQHVNTGDQRVRMVVAWPNFDSALGPEAGVAMEVLEPAPEFMQ